MKQTLLHALNGLGREVRAAHPMGAGDSEKAKSEVIRARWDALDAGLRALGVEPYRPDQYGCMNGQPHAWHTAQDIGGHIIGIWSGSPEQAVAELAEGHGTYIVWCVRDWTDDLKSPLIDHYQSKYTTRANQQPIVAPMTTEPQPIAAPAPAAPTQPALFDMETTA